MAFDVASAYGSFMGRFSSPLASRTVDLLDPQPGQSALDVGCGTGILTARLVDRLGADAVAAVDPSAPFVAATAAALPGADVRRAGAERLPYDDGSFDLAVAQLAVHFMKDPVAGLAEMARVTRPGGVVAASVWDHAGDRGPLGVFWTAVRDLDPAAQDESGLAGTGEGQLAGLFDRAGLVEVEPGLLTVTVGYDSVEQWWQPYTLGIGPAGDHVARLDEEQRALLRDRCAALLPAAPFDVVASAWFVRGRHAL